MANILQLTTEGAPLFLRIAKGADFRQQLQLTIDGMAPFDLTGSTLSGSIRKANGAPPVAYFTFENTDPTNGIVVMSLTANDSAALPTGATDASPASKYLFSVQIQFPNGSIGALFGGPLTINPGATYA